MGVLSEESGLHAPERDLIVVVDPLDGSTNAAAASPGSPPACARSTATGHGWRWWSTCPTGAFTAVRGGASVDGVSLVPTGCTALAEAVVGISGLPPESLGWRQFRALGAVALDLCAVAEGTLDGYVDASSPSAHGAWDYLGGALVRRGGRGRGRRGGRDLNVLDPAARRTPVAAGTPELLDALVSARRRAVGT